MIETVDVEPIEATPPRRSKWLRYVLIALAIAVLFAVFESRFGQDPRLVDSPLVGQPLPELTLEYLEQDGALTLSDLRGQALVINFWASWCFPCRIEHPALTTAAAEYADRGVHFIGIVYQDGDANAIGFLDEFGRGINYTYLADPESRAIVELGTFGVPETYFVDADGIVRDRFQGDVSLEVLRERIDATLAAAAS